MSIYRYAVGDASGSAPDWQLTEHRARKLTFRIDGPPTVALTLDGRRPDAEHFTPQATDLWVWRTRTDGDPADLMFRGRCWGESDDITETEHTYKVAAFGYRGLLNFRRIGAAGRYFAPGTDQAAIAWALIDESQDLDGGLLGSGITDGIGSTSSTTRELTLPASAKIGEEIGKLGRLDDGFEWEIGADLALNRWYPTRGADNGVVLDFRGLVRSARRTFIADENGNHVIVTGGDGTTPVEASSAGIASDPRGRIELADAYPSVVEQSTLDARAPQLLADVEVIRPEWTVVLNMVDEAGGRSRWEGPDHVWLGDTVTLGVRSTPRLNVADAYRVLEVSIADGIDGDEVVSLGLVAAE